MRPAASVMTLTFLLTGCALGGQEPVRTPTSATRAASSSATSGSDQGIAPCRGLHPLGEFSYELFSVPTPSTWEVTYAVLANGCDRPVTLDLAVAQRSEGVAITSVHVVAPVDREVQGTRRLSGPLRGVSGPVEVAPGEKVQVVSSVRVRSLGRPTQLPTVAMTSTIDGRSTSKGLPSPVTMCSCAQPAPS